jgi:PAS domain S-box-containing protein
MKTNHQNENVTGNGARMEQALRASELSYHRLFEAAQDGILILDVDTGRINDVNPFLIKLLGFSHGEMVGKTVGEISPFKDIWSNKVMLERLQEDGYVRYHDLPLETRDGRKIAVEFVSNVYQAGDKKVIQCNIRDITERKRAEEAFRESEQRFRALFEGAHEGIFQSTLGGQFHLANTALARMLGYASSQELIAGVTDIGRQLNVALGVRAEFQRQISERGEVQNFEFQARRKDGATIWLSENAHAVRDASGAVLYYDGMLQDITERKRAEEAVRESERRFQTLADISPAGIFQTDAQGQTTYVNPRWCQISGLSATDALGDGWLRAVHPEDRGKLVQGWQAATQVQSISKADYRFVHPDGTISWVLGQAVPEKDHTGRIVGYVGTVTDITERKRAEEALRQSEATLRGVFQAAPIGICIMKDRLFQSANDYWCKSFGYTEKSLLGKSPRMLHESDEEYERVGRELYTHFQEGGIATSETRLRRSDGALRDVILTTAPLRAGDPTAGKVMTIHDITEQRKLEAQFIEAQKMEVIGQLASGVAHDFNNILGVIIGYNDMIMSELGPDSPLRQCSEEIRHATQRAAGLTRQLLIFSRKQTVQPVVLDLNDVVKDLNKMLRRLIDEHIEMTMVPGKQIGRVKADSGYVGQVLMNLVVNARDAMPNGGKLTIATNNVTLDENYSPTGVIPGLPAEASAKAGDYVMLSVSDTGIGMTEEVKARLFEAFFTTKPKGKGTGLGLATCQTIVQQSGGYIDVDSEVGKGTTFKIYFPQVDEPLDTDTKFIKAGPLPRGTETLLVVEDEPSVRHLAAGVLEAQGYTVLRANNGQDALHMAREHKGSPIRLVVTDVIMPLMGGKVMAEWLKTTYPDLKILFTSGYTDDAIAQHGVLDAGVEFLSKPYTPATLVRKVREMLDTPQT